MLAGENELRECKQTEIFPPRYLSGSRVQVGPGQLPLSPHWFLGRLPSDQLEAAPAAAYTLHLQLT